MRRIPQDVGKPIRRARSLRERQTEAESLVWNVLRAKRLCGLKFRRQHPIDPFFGDFACARDMVLVEIDGGYHDYQYEDDQARQRYLEKLGWTVLSFSNEEVLDDVDAVAIAIAKHFGLEPEFGGRVQHRSGMVSPNAPNRQRRRRPK